jgi:hypothetical protein
MQVQGIDVGTKKEFYTTQSDGSGYFEFTHLYGWQLGVVVKKTGYEMGQGTGFYEAPNAKNKTSPIERAVFHMWKLHGPEPMKAYSISTAIPCDGTPTTYDLLTGKKVSNGGDLQIKLVRTPMDINRSGPFNWSATLEVINGGLVEINDLYPYEAPPDGYQSSVVMDMSSGMKNWSPSLTRSFYFVSRNGQNYGRITINIQADFRPPPTYFGANIYLNPSGSRNLEYDRSKKIPANQ